MNQHYLQLYADFIVKVGVNVQPRQNFIIRCPVTMPEFGHACVKAGYEAGAKNCIVRWEDDKLSRLHYEYAKEEDLAAMKPYELRSYLDYAEDPDGCCTLAIHAADPEALAGLDAAKINRVNLARRKFLKPWQEYTMNDRVQWCVAAVPAPSWAAKVFPGIPVEEAMEKLWALIFDVCRVSTGDPVSAWKAHVAEGRRHRDQLNAWNLDHIHMTSSNGTDLTVGLADDATWEGASSKAENGTGGLWLLAVLYGFRRGAAVYQPRPGKRAAQSGALLPKARQGGVPHVLAGVVYIFSHPFCHKAGVLCRSQNAQPAADGPGAG